MSSGWTFADLLRAMFQRGDHPAVISIRDGALSSASYAGLADTAHRLASGLVEAGVQPGDPVVLLAPNSASWIAIRLGLGLAGALAVPLDDLGSADESAAEARASGARWAFASPEHAADLAAWLPDGSRIVVVDGAPAASEPASWEDLLAPSAGPLPTVAPDAPAVLVHTSGTTGAAKRFTLSYRNIWSNVGSITEAAVVGPGDRVLLPLPLHHIYPQIFGMLIPLASGSTIVLPEGTSGPQIATALSRAEVTGIIGVPRLYAALVGSLRQRVRAQGRLAGAAFDTLLNLAIAVRRRFGIDLGRVLFRPLRARLGRRLRLLVSGGARVEPEVLWRLVGLGFEVRSGYGLAETASVFTGNMPGRERLGTEARPFQGGEVRIAEPDETGSGEIQLRGPNVFTGYLDNPDADREAFTADGWFRTGDTGWLDDDGNLTVTGRLKETIVLGGGKKVNPERLEKAYGESSFVAEIAVLERSGALVGLVRPDLDAIRAAGLTRVEDALRITLQERSGDLAPWERLAGYATVTTPLPRTRLGKYRRFLLPRIYDEAKAGRRRVSTAVAPADEALLADPRARAVWDLLQERYREAGIDFDSSLALDLGLDSLEWMTLALEIERRLSIALPEVAVTDLDRVRDLVRLAADAESAPAREPAASPEDWLRPPSRVGRLLARSLHGLNRWLMRSVFRLRVAGLEHLPATGPFVIVANHCSDLDPLVVAAALPPELRQRVHWGGEVSRLFAGAPTRWVSRQLGIFPVDERQPSRTLTLARSVLARADGLVWFPEAWRSPDGEIQRFLPGIGHLLADRPVPAIPVRLFGTFEAMPRGRRWPRPSPLRLRVGAPVDIPPPGPEPEAAEHVATRLREAVAALEDVP